MHQLIHLVARAGGGQNFGGGGRSGGGGGSFGGGGGVGPVFVGGGGGGGGGAGIIVLVFLIIAVVMVVMVVRKRGMKGVGSGDSIVPPTGVPIAPPGGPTLPGQAVPMMADQVKAGIDAIKAHDPGFEEDKFIADAERAFFVVEQGWSELKPEMTRRVMADGIWQQHRVQIEQYRAANKRNVLENLAIANATIIGAESEGGFDTIRLRLVAGCADYDVDMASNKVVRGNKDFAQWAEDWAFRRSSEATTKAEGGTMAQRCPNCGAPLDLDLAGVCKYCHEAVMSGKYDWVLERIDQVGL